LGGDSVSSKLENMLPDNGTKQVKKSFDERLIDPKYLRIFRIVMLFIIMILSPLLYFALVTNFNWNALFNWQFGSLAILTSFLLTYLVYEVRTVAFDTTVAENDQIRKNEIEIAANGRILRKHTKKSILTINELNKEMQDTYNLEKTTKKIDKLNNKLSNLQIRLSYAKFKWIVKNLENRIKNLEKSIKKLKKTPLIDKRFKPYKLERLFSTESKNKYKRIGDSELKSNPKKLPVIKLLTSLPFKGFTVSLSGGVLPLILLDDKKAVFYFYITYTIMMTATSITQFILTKYKTLTDYAASLDRKLVLQEYIIEKNNLGG
jgi:hypothetical protein